MANSADRSSIEELCQKLIAELHPFLEQQKSQIFLEEIINDSLHFVLDHPNGLDAKILKTTIQEMRAAFSVFAPFADNKKATIFGSARVREDQPLYAHTVEVASELAKHDWMVVTGAGPGIMEAGMKGAGADKSIGVSIRLPMENEANALIANDSKHVSMRYFFTRKLMLVKESQAFVCLPGGFGTLDETFELLTLVQTGKSMPVPIVFLDAPGDTYWEQVNAFIQNELVSRELVSGADTSLFFITNDIQEAVSEIRTFYTNYHSLRYVGKSLIIRLQHFITDEQLELINKEFHYLCTEGSIERTVSHKVEIRDNDHTELARIKFSFTKVEYGDLRRLINRLNSFYPIASS
jgi:uncharacterized protein (TIGR00730 family)